MAALAALALAGTLGAGSCSKKNADPALKQSSTSNEPGLPEAPRSVDAEQSSIPFVGPSQKIPRHAEVWLTPPWLRDESFAVNDIIWVPKNEPTIQGAIDRIVDGGHVVVGPGTYRENLVVRGKNVVIRSTAGPRETVIDAGGVGQAIAVLPDDRGTDEGCGEEWQTVLTGFRLVNGTGLLLEESAPDDNHRHGDYYVPMRRGGGVYVRACSPLLTWNVIEGCKGEDGGGVLCEAGSRTLLHANWIRDNGATKGGGIRISNASPVVVNNVIEGNRATQLGGGLYWRERSAPYVSNNTIIRNGAGQHGGGIYASNAPPGTHFVTVANTLVWGNTAERGADIAFNRPSTRVNLINDAVLEGDRGVTRLEDGIYVCWNAGNVALGDSPGLDGPWPTKTFAAQDKGALAWARASAWDFAGRPRTHKDGARETVDIGAIQLRGEPAKTTYWDLPDLPAAEP